MKRRFLSVLTICLLLVTALTACGTTSGFTEKEVSAGMEVKAAAFPMKESADGFRVMIVGSGSPQYEVDRGQSSTLVQYKDTYFLVDCGNRTCDTLLKNGIQTIQIENMFFTHQHFDHNADFWDFFMSGSVNAFPRKTLTLVGPDVQQQLDATLSYYKDDIDQRIEGLHLTNDAAIYGTTVMEITENTTFEMDGVTISTMLLPHGLDNYAYKFEADGQIVVVTGDFLNEPALADFAKDADILIADGMLTSTFSYIPNEKARQGLKKALEVSHATEEQVFKIVNKSGAKKTVLTHLGGDSGIEHSKEVLAAMGYNGEVLAAYDGLIIEP